MPPTKISLNEDPRLVDSATTGLRLPISERKFQLARGRLYRHSLKAFIVLLGAMKSISDGDNNFSTMASKSTSIFGTPPNSGLVCASLITLRLGHMIADLEVCHFTTDHEHRG